MEIKQIKEQKKESGTFESAILESLAAANIATPTVPAGYIPIKLSTEGKIGAPKLFHVRNFKTKDIMALALTNEEDLPERVIQLMKDLIYEEDVAVESFHEKEIIETLLLLYHAFYSPTFDIEFPFNDEDIEFIKKNKSESAAKDNIDSLQNRQWIPRTVISIEKDIDTYKLSPKFSSKAIIKSKNTGFTLGFRLPAYGDALVVKKWIRNTFEKEENFYKKTAQKLEIQRNMLERIRKGENIDLDSIPKISQQEEEEYNNFYIRRASSVVDVIRALHLCVFDGNDVSKESLSKRYEYIQDPRVDEKIARKLDDYFENLEFGVKPQVQMYNPITEEVCLRDYSFRLIDILQALQLSKDDEYEFISSV